MSELSSLVRPGLVPLVAYSPGSPPSPNAIKLDANEFPRGLSPQHTEALARHLAGVSLNRYPDPRCMALREACVEALGIDADRVVFGNGSDELIFLLCSVFAEPAPGQKAAAVLYPTPSFGMFRIAALAAGMEPVEVPLGPEFDLDVAAMETAFRERAPNLAFIPRPNNPTGTLWSGDIVFELARRHPATLVVVDEAYAEYCGVSLLSREGELPNLVVMRTLSKIGLAALRVGFVQGPPAVIDALEKVRAPYNIGTLNQEAATWVLCNALEEIRAQCKEVVAERERLFAALTALEGVHPYDSAANLILFRVAGATCVAASLRRAGVIVRCFGTVKRLAECLRVTIGTRAENDRFLDALSEAMA